MFFLADTGLCDDPDLLSIIGFLRTLINLIKILIPIGLILIGSVDLGRAVMAGDEKQIKEHQNRLLKRALSAVIVFFVASIVGALMSIVGDTQWKKCWETKTANSSVQVEYNNLS
jgi:hypothetical protein